MIGGAWRGRVGVRGFHHLPPNRAPQAHVSHQSSNGTARCIDAFAVQLAPNLADPVDPEVLLPDAGNLRPQDGIPLRPGLLVIFGAYYQHMTTRQFPDRDRVSIAGNLYPYEPTGIPIQRELRQGVLSNDLWEGKPQ